MALIDAVADGESDGEVDAVSVKVREAAVLTETLGEAEMLAVTKTEKLPDGVTVAIAVAVTDADSTPDGDSDGDS